MEMGKLEWENAFSSFVRANIKQLLFCLVGLVG
jgi:hypothetical protein